MVNMENKFCFLKGIVDCHSGVIQNCNNMRTEKCPLDEERANVKKKVKEALKPKQNFCFFKGELVDCSDGRVQDCNNQRSLRHCPLEDTSKKQDPWEQLKNFKDKKPDKSVVVSILRELMLQESVSLAMMEIMEPEMKKRVEETRKNDIHEAVEAMRNLGHDDNEIKQQLMIRYKLTNGQIKEFL